MYSLVQWPNVQHTLLCSAKQQNSTVVAVWYSMQSVQLGSGRPHKSSVGHCRLLLLLGRARQKGGFHSDHDEEEDPGEKDRMIREGKNAKMSLSKELGTLP